MAGAFGPAQNLIAMVDLTVEDVHLAGSAKSLLAVARHIYSDAPQSLQQGLVSRHVESELRVLQFNIEAGFLTHLAPRLG